MRKIVSQLLLAFLFCVVSISSSDADDNDFLTLGGGAFEVINEDDIAPAGFAAYRFSPRLFADWVGPGFQGIGPMVGLMANTDGGVYGYGDLFADIRPTENLVIWPSVGIGGYRQGSSLDLGGVFQFHVEFFLGYRVSRSQMLGVSYQHISNATIQNINPGADSVFVTYSIALPSLF